MRSNDYAGLMGPPVEFWKTPLNDWQGVHDYRFDKKVAFWGLLVLLGIVLFFLIGDLAIRAVYFDSVYWGVWPFDLCCYSILIPLTVLLASAVVRRYRHLFFLGIDKRAVYKRFRVVMPDTMAVVVEGALGSLGLEYMRIDPHADRETSLPNLLRNVVAGFSLVEHDIVTLVHVEKRKRWKHYESEVLLWPAVPENASVMRRIMKAIDEGFSSPEPDLRDRPPPLRVRN